MEEDEDLLEFGFSDLLDTDEDMDEEEKLDSYTDYPEELFDAPEKHTKEFELMQEDFVDTLAATQEYEDSFEQLDDAPETFGDMLDEDEEFPDDIEDTPDLDI